MALSDIQLGKQNTGSAFGGGWGLSDLVQQKKKEEEEQKNNQQAIKLSDIKIEKADIKDKQAEQKPEVNPKEEEVEEQQNPFLELNNRILENYEKINTMKADLDNTLAMTKETPEIIKPSLVTQFEAKQKEYNELVNQFNADIQERDKQIQEQHQTRLDTERLQGSMSKGKQTQKGKLIDKFTSTEDVSYWGGTSQDPTRLAGTPFGTLAKAIGTQRAIEKIFPEEIAQLKELRTDIYTQANEFVQGEDKKAPYSSDIIATIQSRLTGKSIEEVRKEMKEPIRNTQSMPTLAFKYPEYKDAVSIYQAIENADRPGSDFMDALNTMSWSGLLMIMGGQAISSLYKMAPDVMNSIKTKTKIATPEQFREIMSKATSTNPDPKAVKAFKQITTELNKVGLKPIDVIRGKMNVTYTAPRFSFEGGKLYGGLPADEIAKSIIETGKVAQEVARLNPAELQKITTIVQQTSPLLVDKIAQVKKQDLIEQGVPKSTLDKLSKPDIINLQPKVEVLAKDITTGEREFKQEWQGLTEEEKSIKEMAERELPEDYQPEPAKTEQPKIKETERELPEGIKAEAEKEPEKAPEQPISEKEKAEIPKGKAIYDTQEKELVMPKELNKRLEGIPKDLESHETLQYKIGEIKNIKKGASLDDYLDSEKIKGNFPVKFNIEKGKVTVRLDEDNYLITNKDLTEEQRFNDIYEGIEAIKEKLPTDTKLSIPELKYEGTIKDFIEPTTTKPAEAEAESTGITAKREEITKETTPTETTETPFWDLEEEKPILRQETVQKSDIERIEDIKRDTQKIEDKLIIERVEELKKQREQYHGVQQGGLIKDKEGYVKGAIPRTSNNPKWYRDYYAAKKRPPSDKDLKEIAKEQLLEGYEEDIPVPYREEPNPDFVRVHNQIEAYDNIISTLEDHKGEVIESIKPTVNKEAEKLPPEVRKFLQAEEKYPERAAKEDIKEFKEGVVKYDYQQPATNKQKRDIHQLAKDKKLIIETKSGKISYDRYKHLAKEITGKNSVKDMNREEAEIFEDAIQQVYQRQPWEPPVIPYSNKIVPKDFFENLKFKDPIEHPQLWAKGFITPKDFYMRELGAGKLLENIIEADRQKHLEQLNLMDWANDIVKRINKKAPVGQKIKKFVKNKPTENLARFRDLLDEYVTLPDSFSKEDKEIFSDLRNLTQNLLKRTNEVRNKLGLEPIKDIGAYVPHFLDELAGQIVKKKYPFPEDVKYWIGRNMPKKVRNPTEMQRKVRDDLEEVFSKDLGKLLKALIRYDLRDIYLSEPYSVLRAELNALGDKIPANVRKEVEDFLKYDIFDYPTQIDQLFNATVKVPTDIINFALKPFGRVITNPARSISRFVRWSVTRGAIAGRMILPVRNFGQRLLTMDLYQPKYFLKAQFMPTPKWLRDMIKDTTFWKVSAQQGYEDVPASKITIDKLTMTPYKISHAGKDFVSNVDTAMKAGAYYAEEMVKLSNDPNSSFYKYAQRVSAKNNIPLKDLLWTYDDVKAEAIEAGSLTQWLYYKTGMPKLYRGHIPRAAFTLQSWFMNYFGKHIPEAITRTFTGRTSRGKLLRPIDRMNWLKGTAIIMGTLWGLRKAFNLSYEKYLLPWGIALNTNFLSPVGQVIMGAWKRVTAKSDWVKRQAEWQIKNASRIFIPYYLAVKDVLDWMNGERSLKETLFYTEGRYDKEEEKPKANVRKRLPESYSGTKKSSVSIRDRLPESYQNLGKSGGVSIKEQLPESYR